MWTLVGMSQKPDQKGRVNVRRAEVMERVEKEIRQHYESRLINNIRNNGNTLELEHTRFFLATEFGFCNGVRRAIDIAYAAKRVFPDSRIFLIGEIIHNPEVNRQLTEMGVRRLPWKELNSQYDELNGDDVVIVPAFGVPTEFMDLLEEKGVSIVDTTCGDVMKVWKRVKNYALQQVTSIIHGKTSHEETRATASRALGPDGKGKYLIIFTREDAETLADYINGRGDRKEFMQRFASGMSPGFDPDTDLDKIGVANQTTMLKGETQQIQQILQKAIIERDGSAEKFHVYDTICGATQDRQNALFDLLTKPIDVMFVVGGYNSSNTTHLVEIAEKKVPTYFIESADCIESLQTIRCYQITEKAERSIPAVPVFADLQRTLTVGVTAGASCPGNLVEETIKVVAQLRREKLPGIFDAL